MKLVEINWSPTDGQLRQFGIICLFALPFLGWLWSAGPQTVTWLGGAGLILAICGLFLPRLLKPVFVGLMLLVLPIGMVVSELAMVLIYFGVFLPIGLSFTLMRRDALKRNLDCSKASYWEEKKAPLSILNYYRQW
jgi:hypothetical protein